MGTSFRELLARLKKTVTSAGTAAGGLALGVSGLATPAFAQQPAVVDQPAHGSI